LEVQETDAVGVQRSRAGAATGRALATPSVDFDALLSATPRRHVARIVGDAMEGTWVESSAGSVITGTFRAVRTVSQ
jgi:hypothetical protein